MYAYFLVVLAIQAVVAWTGPDDLRMFANGALIGVVGTYILHDMHKPKSWQLNDMLNQLHSLEPAPGLPPQSISNEDGLNVKLVKLTDPLTSEQIFTSIELACQLWETVLARSPETRLITVHQTPDDHVRLTELRDTSKDAA